MNEKTYTIRELAAALGSSKSTIARLVREHVDPENVSFGEYRGHAQKLINQAGFEQLKALLIAPNPQNEANQETIQSDSNAPASESSASKGFMGEEREIIALLRSQLEAKDRQISDLTAALTAAQEATRTAQALHAATAAELRRLTAAQDTPPDPPEDPQQEREPGEGNDTTPRTVTAQESIQEAPAADQKDQDPEPAAPPTLRDRLRYLFTGKQ